MGPVRARALARDRAGLIDVRARASIVAEACHGTTRFVELRSEAPLLVRATPDAVYLVGGAAGPLGGDELTVEVRVCDGARCTVRSAAATLAQPGRTATRSWLRTRLDLGAGAELSFRPEPLIAVRGCDHTNDTRIDLAEDASLELGEELVLGRHDEASGRVRTRLHVVRAGRTILRHDLDLGGDAPGWRSGVVLGGARAATSLVVVGPDAPDAVVVRVDRVARTSAAWLPFAPRAAMLLALGPTLRAARNAAACVRFPA